MKPFHTVAIPDADILEGRFTMDVFAADIWETYVEKTEPRNTFYNIVSRLIFHESITRDIVTPNNVKKKGTI